MNKKKLKLNIILNLTLSLIFFILSSFLHLLYETKTKQILVSSREEYLTADNNYKLVVEKISEANILPFELDDLRFVVGKKIEDKWIYKDVFVVPFEYSLHHGIEYKLTWIDGGVIIKTIAEKQYHSKVYRIYFEDMF